jgi:hypothetical protein
MAKAKKVAKKKSKRMSPPENVLCKRVLETPLSPSLTQLETLFAGRALELWALKGVVVALLLPLK